MKKIATTISIKPTKKWKVFSDKGQLKKICEPTKIINLNEVREILEGTETYYLNKHGLFLQQDGKRNPEKDAVFQWAVLEGYKTEKGGPVIAWAYKNDNGKFNCAEFGTRYDFNLKIANLIKTDKK